MRCSGLGFFVEGCCCAPPMLPIMTAWMVLGVLGLLGRTCWTTYGICQLRVVCRLGPFGAGGLPTAHWSVCMKEFRIPLGLRSTHVTHCMHHCPRYNVACHLGIPCASPRQHQVLCITLLAICLGHAAIFAKRTPCERWTSSG